MSNAMMTSPYHYQVKPPLCIIGEVNFASDVTTLLIRDVHNWINLVRSLQLQMLVDVFAGIKPLL